MNVEIYTLSAAAGQAGHDWQRAVAADGKLTPKAGGDA